MAKRVTIIVPEWPTNHTPTSMFGCKIEAVEDMPEPLIQEFRVQVTSPSPLDPFAVSEMTASLSRWAHPWRAFIITEVTP